jgi:hypothetical protein
MTCSGIFPFISCHHHMPRHKPWRRCLHLLHEFFLVVMILGLKIISMMRHWRMCRINFWAWGWIVLGLRTHWVVLRFSGELYWTFHVLCQNLLVFEFSNSIPLNSYSWNSCNILHQININIINLALHHLPILKHISKW